MQDLTDFMREFLDYYFTQVHTSLPGVVVEYDSKTRRATVQPSLKRRAGNKEYVTFPLLIDVPVLFSGTKKYTIHIPLEKDDEVAIYFSERALEAWKDIGQDGIEDPDPRRYDLCDAYCVPGLQPQEFIDVPAKGLTIKHKTAWDGDFISHVIMDDDKIEIKYKEKANILMEDDKIECKTEHNTTIMTKKHIQMTNGIVIYDIDEGVTKLVTKDTFIESEAPVGIEGTKTQLGGGALQPYWSAETSAWTQWPVFIPPIPWPPGLPVPPAPPIICMALNGLKNAILQADTTAKSSCAKAIK
jgi:hypothetical protein